LREFKVGLDKVLSFILMFLMGTITINVLWQVFSRFILNNPSSFTEELARYMLIWIGILGAAFVAGQKLHLAIDLLSTKLKGRSNSYLEIFIQTAIFVFALTVMVIGGTRLVYITLQLNQISAALQIKLGYVYLVLPISGLLIMFYNYFFIIEEMKKLRHVKTSSLKN
jgi:TRAP-type C4-dicarboxylate transport system permease small subunit